MYMSVWHKLKSNWAHIRYYTFAEKLSHDKETYCMRFKLWDLLWLARPKIVNSDDVICASSSQEHTTWTHTYLKTPHYV